jgi:hypothetical protein
LLDRAQNNISQLLIVFILFLSILQWLRFFRMIMMHMMMITFAKNNFHQLDNKIVVISQYFLIIWSYRTWIDIFWVFCYQLFFFFHVFIIIKTDFKFNLDIISDQFLTYWILSVMIFMSITVEWFWNFLQGLWNAFGIKGAELSLS